MQKIIKTIDGINFEIDHFDIAQTFECGQCFRWNRVDKNTYIGVVEGQVIEISQNEGKYYLNISINDLSNTWMQYFDFDRDYASVINKISTDKVMVDAIKFASGIRLLKQDAWETLISFILSANNNIPRIKKIIECLCQSFGKEVIYKDKVFYTFPSAKDMEGVTLEDIKEIRCGYRGAYILDAVYKVNHGIVDLYQIKDFDTNEARKELLKIKGVGPKVADCVLLFSMGKYDCYPMDVWIRKITEHFYFNKKASEKEIKEFAKTYWGDHAGFAQQYLFHYARNLKDVFTK